MDDDEARPEAQAYAPSAGSSAPHLVKDDEFTDGRPSWDWKTKFPDVARRKINTEAIVLVGALAASLLGSATTLGLSHTQVAIAMWEVPAGSTDGSGSLIIQWKALSLFFVGCVGGTTFSIKWLIHAVAKGRWHADRRYWRLFVPALGGVYACAVLALLDAGLVGTHAAGESRSVASSAALAFLVGYFSDGVSGLLTNIANAVFGTVQKK